MTREASTVREGTTDPRLTPASSHTTVSLVMTTTVQGAVRREGVCRMKNRLIQWTLSQRVCGCSLCIIGKTMYFLYSASFSNVPYMTTVAHLWVMLCSIKHYHHTWVFNWDGEWAFMRNGQFCCKKILKCSRPMDGLLLDHGLGSLKSLNLNTSH